MTAVAPFSGRYLLFLDLLWSPNVFKNAGFAMDMNHDIYTEIVDTRSLREGGS